MFGVNAGVSRLQGLEVKELFPAVQYSHQSKAHDQIYNSIGSNGYFKPPNIGLEAKSQIDFKHIPRCHFLR